MTSFFRHFIEFLLEVQRVFVSDNPLRRRDVRAVVWRQILFTGQHALRLVALVAVILGMMTVAQSASQLSRFGGQDALGSLLIAAFVREAGPLITVIVVVSRSVSAVASELSSMKANGEIDSLKNSGISPIGYLVIPRIIGGSLSLLFLAMHFVWIALLVGFASAQVFVNIPWDRFVNNLLNAFTPTDLGIFLFKTFGLGIIVFALACFFGLKTKGNNFEIPIATTQAVVYSFIFAFAFQIFLSSVYYLSLLYQRGVVIF